FAPISRFRKLGAGRGSCFSLTPPTAKRSSVSSAKFTPPRAMLCSALRRLLSLGGAEDVRAVVEALRGRSECTGKVRGAGFGLGGKLGCLAATETKVDCAISYYGFGIDFGLNFVSRITCPLVIHFAENDPQIPPEAVARIKEGLSGRPDAAIYLYPGVAPGF